MSSTEISREEQVGQGKSRRPKRIFPAETRRAKNGDIVTIDLTMTPEDGVIPQPLFDTTGQITFVLGWGNYLPGLHDLVKDMAVGESIESASVDAGWGAKDPEKIVKISKQPEVDYTSSVTLGLKLNLGAGVEAVVTEVTEDYFVVDANPPMAGSSYSTSLTVLAIDAIPSSFSYQNEEQRSHSHTSLCANADKALSHLNDGDHPSPQGCRKVIVDGIPQQQACCNICSVSSSSTISSLSECCDGENDDIALLGSNEEGASADPGMTFCHPVSTTATRFQVASFGLGCFWGGELAFMRARGVVGTRVGYTQGHTPNPSYDDVCLGTTAHVEAILLIYDPNVVTYEELVQIALGRLDDTTSSGALPAEQVNAVWGWDRIAMMDTDEAATLSSHHSSQYRHGIYYHNHEQLRIAERYSHKAKQYYNVEIKPATQFYDAEQYHQQYLLKGGQSAKKGALEPIRCYG